LQAVFPDGTGTLHWGTMVPRTDNYTANIAAWPAIREVIPAAMLRESAQHDVYVCPYLGSTKKRAKGKAQLRWVIHTDVDNDDLDLQKIRDIGGFAISSGTKGHAHVYVPLSEPITQAVHTDLCRKLCAVFDGDPAKHNDNDLLRPPGTLNHKKIVPMLVEWLVPFNGSRVDPGSLDRLLTGMAPAMHPKLNGHSRIESAEFDLDAYPTVAEAIAEETGDRSVDSHRIVAACVDSGLTLTQTRWAVNQHPGCAERLSERDDDDVQTSWLKLIDDRRIRSQTTGIPAERRKGDDANMSQETDEAATDPTPVFADKLLTRSDLRMLPDPEPLIYNVLDQGTVALLYGKWGTAKTFTALDWAACVATGTHWQDRRCEQRRVLYVVGEGAFGFKGRVDAWEIGWDRTISDEWLSIYPHPVNLTNASDIDNLRALIEWGGYSFVILDTLARCMVGADENSARDGGIVVDAMTKLLESTPGGRGVVLGVHHAGKDGKTLRGTSAFEAAADTVYFTQRDDELDLLELNREKRKDGPEHDHHLFSLKPVPGTKSAILGAGHRPAPEPKPVPTPTAKPRVQKLSLPDMGNIVYKVLWEQPGHKVSSKEPLYAAMRDAGHGPSDGFPESDVRRALEDLLYQRRIEKIPGRQKNSFGYKAYEE
jgi:hypothetical protein